MKEITIKAHVPDEWVDSFCSMLKEMEDLGKIGSSRNVIIFSDGDGDFRPEFDISVPFKRLKPFTNQNDDRMFDIE